MTSDKPGQKPSRFSLILAITIAAIAGLVIYRLFSGWGYDDPYITYRYAQNLAEGRGPVFNTSEKVLSTTTPLFTLLLAGLYAIQPNLPEAANLISATALAATGLVLWILAQGWNTPYAAWGMLLLTPTFPLLAGTTGSETPLYLALGAGAFAAYAYRRYTTAALSAALATLARPDAMLIAVILGIHFLFRRYRGRTKPDGFQGKERFPRASLPVFVLPLLTWAGFATWYYGSPIPTSLMAKQAQGILSVSTLFPLSLTQQILPFYQEYPLYTVLSGAALLGLAASIFTKSAWRLFLLWPLAYTAGYWMLGVSSYYWYYAPLALAFIVLAGLGLEIPARLIGNGVLRNKINEKMAEALSMFSLLIALAPGIAQIEPLLRTAETADPRLPIYTAAGIWLNKHTLPTDQIGLLEVGIIGYYAQRPVVDFAGLIQPDVAEHMAAGDTYTDSAIYALETYRPEVVVLHRGVFPDVEAAYISQNCAPLHTIAGSPYHYEFDLNIYTCNEAVAP